MRSGRLRDSVIIQSKVDGTDDRGESIDEFITVFKAKCDFKIVSGIDLLQAGLSLNNEFASILMRFDSRLNHKHIITYNDNQYEVASIKPTTHRDMIVTVSRQII